MIDSWECINWKQGERLHRRLEDGTCESGWSVTLSYERNHSVLPWLTTPQRGPLHQIHLNERRQFHRAEDCDTTTE